MLLVRVPVLTNWWRDAVLCLACQSPGTVSGWQTSRRARNMPLQTGTVGVCAWRAWIGLSPDFCFHFGTLRSILICGLTPKNFLRPHRCLYFLTKFGFSTEPLTTALFCTASGELVRERKTIFPTFHFPPSVASFTVNVGSFFG